jgi:NAD(P)-dependent dehydrogenase (short-subunit alcohol dehydrogenase family)
LNSKIINFKKKSQFGINHLGHFYLTNKLLPIMYKSALKSGEGRIINVSSVAHEMGTGDINFDDINYNNFYSPFLAYSQSKLANIMFSNELNNKLKVDNIPIYTYSLHPGVIYTNLCRDFSCIPDCGFMCVCWACVKWMLPCFSFFLMIRYLYIYENCKTGMCYHYLLCHF